MDLSYLFVSYFMMLSVLSQTI